MQGTIEEHTNRNKLLDYAKKYAPGFYNNLKIKRINEFNSKLGELRKKWKNTNDPTEKKEIENEAELIKEEMKLYE